MTIPNAVGRIDAITEAIREGDRLNAVALTGCEHLRLLRRISEIKAELSKVEKSCDDVRAFGYAIEHNDQAWAQAMRDCGSKMEVA
jgi:hypothetical protein